jgi:hypothetical protein
MMDERRIERSLREEWHESTDFHDERRFISPEISNHPDEKEKLIKESMDLRL